MNPVLEYAHKKNYNIFESIQLLYDMDMYGNMDNIFKELKDIIPEKIHISTKGIEDEKTVFFLNELNDCSLKPNDKKILQIPDVISFVSNVQFIKNNEVLFRWFLKDDYFWMNNKIWTVFEKKYKMEEQQIQQFIKNILEQHCKMMRLYPGKLWFSE